MLWGYCAIHIIRVQEVERLPALSIYINQKKTTNKMNQKLVELSKKYDSIQKERAASDIRGENSYYLYLQIIAIEREMKVLQEKRNNNQ